MVNELQEMIDHAKHIVFFGGAGVSVASGIPDFRNGLYKSLYEGLTPEMILSQSFFYLHPDVFQWTQFVPHKFCLNFYLIFQRFLP